MPNYSQGKMGKKRENGRHVISKLLILTGFTIAIVVFFTHLISEQQHDRSKTVAKERELDLEVQKLEKKNSDLNRKHNTLLTDTIQVERYAREELNYVAPGEKVYDVINYKIKPNESGNKTEELKINDSMWEGPIPWQMPALIILISFAVFSITFLLENRNIKNN